MQNAVHFVGFTGDEYNRAIVVFGKPDFYHRIWDGRAKVEVFDGDTVIFANKEREDVVKIYSFDDSGVF